MKERVTEYNELLKDASADEILNWAASEFSGKITFASSLGYEDQVITHMIATAKLNIPIFTLDTGRMFQETYSTMERTRERYGLNIEVFFPDYHAVEQMVTEHGPNLFYESIEYRKLCCRIRKTEPVKRALAGKAAWITGLRRAQSITREELDVVMWDEENQLFKISPLAAWELQPLKEYISKFNIPYNPLHDKGFPSIGCLPCTRAVPEGGDVREGRWWWEDPDKKECGLHSK
jgi:phosphoadenosine phosphosulfate reductase